MTQIAEIFRFPVKGLSPEPMQRVWLDVGAVIPFDRAYAIENGPSDFDPGAPKWISKNAFLMLMKHERLAELRTKFDETTQMLTIRKDGEVLAEGRLDTKEGRHAIETFFERYAADDLRGPPRVISAPGFSFQDTSTGMVVSLINLETVREIGRKLGVEVHPLRFRGNLYVEGLPAWEEFSWVGTQVVGGGVRFEVTKRIDRCAAVNVDPLTGARDLNLPKSLMQIYDHLDCGIYLKVLQKGALSVGDTIGPVAG